jgi:tetratricopeptide (TPR) repeat protein
MSSQRSASLGLAVMLFWMMPAFAPAARAQAPDAEAAAPPLATPSSVTPEDQEQAARQEKEAKQLHRLGRFDEALRLYEAAFRLGGRPGTLFNMANCNVQLGQLASPGPMQAVHYRRAIYFFQRYLALATSEPRRAEIEALIRDLEQRTARAQAAQSSAAPAAASTVTVPSTADAGEAPSRPFYRRWYVWAGVAAVVAAGVTLGVVYGVPPHNAPAPSQGLGAMRFFSLGVAR